LHEEKALDPITIAIVGALAKLSENVIADAYQALKAAIADKCGIDSDVAKAVEEIEKKPDSSGRKETLREEIVNTKIDSDPELIKLANALIEKLRELPGGQSVINQTVTGNNNIFSGSGNVTVTDKPNKTQ
jgi:hypothetical protein